jgi:hypothetical protein
MMKLSNLMRQLEKAIVKYGDIEIGALGTYEAGNINGIASLYKIIGLRIMNSPHAGLPGMPIEEQEMDGEETAYAVLFYVNN